MFVAEFVAMKQQGIDAWRGLRYKLRMMGLPISGLAYIYGDNMSVVHNTSRPKAVLRRKATEFSIMQCVNHLQWVSP